MHKKTILKFNSKKPVRPAAWLALAVLAVGAFGNSVQAQTPWLDENLNSLTAGSALTVGGKCVAVGTAGYATGATGGGAVRFFKAAAISGTDARWSLSDSYATPRPSGYITFKIQQTPGVTASATGYMTFRLGANDANNLSSGAAAWFEARFYNLPYVTGTPSSATANLMTYLGAAGAKIGNYSINNGSTPVKIEIWYNNTSAPMNYTSPATQATVALNANSFVIYAGNALVTAAATGSAIVSSVTTTTATPATSIGKIGFVVGTSQSCDFIVDDIYAADSAPSGIAISSSTTATAQAGYPFSYTIGTSGGAATSYGASNLPSYLSLNTTSGLISGTVPMDATPGSLPSISISATGTTGTANSSLTLNITAPPAAAPAFAATAVSASGNLTRAFTYQIQTTTTSPSSTPTSYTITSGALPAGLNLTTTGAIAGTPTGSPSVTVVTYTATNPAGTSAEQTLTITIDPAPLYTWNNTGTAWASASSWTNNAVPANSASTDTAAFGNLGSSATSVDVGVGKSIGGIVFNSGAYAYTWTGTDITVGNVGGITNNSAEIQTFGNKVINSSGSATWSSASGGSLVLSGGIDLTTSTSTSSRILTFAGAGNVTVSGAIVNGGTATAGGVTFSSTGVNLLSGNNTYGGATTISAGSTLKIGSANALGSTSGNTVVSSGGALDLNGQTIFGEPLSLAGVGISSGGALINSGTTDASWGGTVALVNSATYINASAAKKITLSGVVSGDAKGIYKMGPGTLELSGANSFTGTNQVVDGTMILSAANSASGYSLAGYANDIYPVLKVSAANALSSSATLAGSSSSTKTGTLDFTTAGDYTINQYNIGNMNFTNSSGSATTLTFTNATNTLSTGGGRTLANKSANLTITFNGELAISGTTIDTCSISAIGPIVISNRVFNSNTSITRSLEKLETGTLTMYGVNSYNGTTTVSKGTLSIPTGGSLTSCGNTIVKGSGSSVGNSASLNLAGAAGVVQVSTNGFVRGYTSGSTTTLGTISSLQVQEAGAVEVAVGSTWTTGGTIDFAVGSKVLVTGTPITGNTYTLMTASADITGSPILAGAAGWALRVDGANLLLEEVAVIDIYNIPLGDSITFSDIITGTAPLVKKGLGTGIITGDNNYTGGTVLQAGTLQVENVNGLGTGAVTLTSGTLKSTVDLDLARLNPNTSTVGTGNPGYQETYGALPLLKYSGNSTTINGAVTLDVASATTMTMLTLVGNSDANSLVTKIGAGTLKLMGGTSTTVLGGWKIEAGTVWFTPSSNNGGGNGPITLAGGTAKFSKLQNSNGTFTGYEVPSDLTVESDGVIQYDPSPLTLLGQNNLGFNSLSIGARTLEVATATTSTVVGQGLPSVNFKSATLTGNATLKNPANLDLNLQAVSGTSGFTKTGLGTLYLSDQPNQAAAFARLTSGMTVESITVEYAGSGYAVAPAVTLVGGGGTGTTATATIDNKGRVTSIAVNTAGSGYTSLPRVVIAAPPKVATENTYTGPTTVQEGKLNLNGSYVSSVTVKSGAALQLDCPAPALARCSIDAISSGNSGYLTDAANAYVKGLYLTKSVKGYAPNSTLTLTIDAPRKTDGTTLVPGGVAATAEATVNSDGVISALTILTGGSGYVISPRVTIPPPTVPTVVATTTGSITFESGATLALNIASPTSASYTLITADGGIVGTPSLETAISGYALTKSIDGKSLILDQVDTTKPVITLIGSSTVNVDYGASYADLGATVDDNKDATRSINGVGSVNTLVPGSYTISFNTTDDAGNAADTVTRTVVVGPAPVTDGYAVYISSNGLPAGTAFNAKVNGVTAGLVYSFGSANGMPQNNGGTAVPVKSGNQLTYTFDVKDDSALTVTYQTSTDLVTWTEAQPVTIGIGSSPAGFVKKQVQATGSGKLFVKINVTHP